MVKKNNILICVISCLLAIVSVFAFSFLSLNYSQAEVIIDNPETILNDDDSLNISDNYYTVRFQGFNSNNTVISPEISVPILVVDKEITYICYDWSELSHIGINIQRTSTSNSQFIFTGVKLRLSFMQTENLSQNIQDFNGEKYLDIPLFSSSESLSFLPINYYINEQDNMEEGNQTKFGYGFGLYKFEFVYSYMDMSDTNQPNGIEKSIGSVYFAVLPDNIDNLNGSFGINYEISSSTTFLNAYTFTINNNIYQYANPYYIEWFVEGVDEQNMRYVLTESDRVDEYFTYSSLYKGAYPYGRNGNTFYFDSNGIEADFRITCNIYDTSGSLKNTASIEVTTIKVDNTSYLWLIIIGIILALVIIASIILIIVLKKKEKMY